jgi:hypothetical protein
VATQESILAFYAPGTGISQACLMADKSTAEHQRLAWQTTLIAAAAS